MSNIHIALECCVEAYENEEELSMGSTRASRYYYRLQDNLAVIAFPGTNPGVEEDVRCDARYKLHLLRSSGISAFAKFTDEQAHEGFLERLKGILLASDAQPSSGVGRSLPAHLQQLIREGKRILLVGHSLGGSIAILTAIWLLQCWEL